MAFISRLMARLLKFKFSSGGHDEQIDRSVLYAVYGNDIATRLKRIHAHPERDGPEGFLTVVLYGRTPAHVHCTFVDIGNSVLCEARVGLGDRAGVVVPERTAAALQEAGYWQDASSGRFVFPYEITADSGLWGGMSVAILNPLIGVFGARAESKIEIVAPLAPFRDERAIQQRMRSGDL